jgi:hypothetical protein
MNLSSIFLGISEVSVEDILTLSGSNHHGSRRSLENFLSKTSGWSCMKNRSQVGAINAAITFNRMEPPGTKSEKCFSNQGIAYILSKYCEGSKGTEIRTPELLQSFSSIEPIYLRTLCRNTEITLASIISNLLGRNKRYELEAMTFCSLLVTSVLEHKEIMEFYAQLQPVVNDSLFSAEIVLSSNKIQTMPAVDPRKSNCPGAATVETGTFYALNKYLQLNNVRKRRLNADGAEIVDENCDDAFDFRLRFSSSSHDSDKHIIHHVCCDGISQKLCMQLRRHSSFRSKILSAKQIGAFDSCISKPEKSHQVNEIKTMASTILRIPNSVMTPA